MPAKSRYSDFNLYDYFYSLVRQIPSGMVCTYGDLARALGDPVSARAVGLMLSENPDPEGTECFRVVLSDGKVGNFTHPLGQKEKIGRLENDGISVTDGKIDNFEKIRFTEFRSSRPLAAMSDEQSMMADQIELHGEATEPLGAVDVSYDGRMAYAALVWAEDGIVHSRYYSKEVNFPYIPTYLTYREGDVMLGAIGDFEGTVLVDGQGIYHPRFCGLASYIGLNRDCATIGVGKSSLSGEVRDKSVLISGREVAGIAMGRYISPGNLIDLKTSVNSIKNDRKAIHLAKEAHDAATYVKKIYKSRPKTDQI